jgi:hypothetical protein
LLYINKNWLKWSDNQISREVKKYFIKIKINFLNGGINMDELLYEIFETYPIRHTPDGKICVTDVIKLLCNTNRPFSIWRVLIDDHPEILADCEDYPFQPGENLPVVHGVGWRLVLGYLYYYRSKHDYV